MHTWTPEQLEFRKSVLEFARNELDTASPDARSAAHTRGLPYARRFCPCTAFTFSASSSRRFASRR